MASFGAQSKRNLATLHPDLQKVLLAAIDDFDFSIICGNRGKADQDLAFANGNSKLKWPQSKHNSSEGDTSKSDAADCMPYPVEWPDRATDAPHEYTRKMGAIYLMAERILYHAAAFSVKLRWGGMFKSFFDGPHFERE